MSSAYSFGTIIDRVQSLSLKTIAGVVIGCSILFYWRSKLSSRHLRKSSTLGGTRNLGNEIVIVTGGSGGIGQHISEQLAREKARVLILDIKAPEFQLSTGIAFYKTDITSTKDVARVASEIRHLYGDPTALVNAAGVFNRGSLLENDEREIRETFEVNTLSHFFLVKEFLPSMIQMNRGHIITVASAASFVTVAEMMAYCCTKASALAFHEGLRQELKHWYNAPGIKTSIIHPLWVQTSLIKGFTQYQSHFSQPVMSPEVVAEAVVEQIVYQKSDQVFLPKRLWLAGCLRAFPRGIQEMIRSSYSQVIWRVRNARLADNAGGK